MSRVGKKPVPVPAKVAVNLSGSKVNIKGPKGELARDFGAHVSVELASGGKQIVVKPTGTSRLARAMYGTARSLIAGMVKGVNEGFVKELEIQGVGFKAAVSGQNVDLALGYSHSIRYVAPIGIKITVADGTKVKIEGCDKQAVGQAAAQIRSYYPPEPYKGKGVRIVGERVRRKEGKTVA